MARGDGANSEQVILEAAEQLFLEKGYALTSTVEIAKRAGCNQALVHYYFRSKNKLFESVFEQKVGLFFSNFLKIDEQQLPFEERLKRKIETHFDMLAAQPQLPFLILNELITNPARLDSLKRKLTAKVAAPLLRLERELKVEIARGAIRPVSAVDLLLTVASLNGMLFLARPVLMKVTGMSAKEQRRFLEHRRQENVTIVMRSLQP